MELMRSTWRGIVGAMAMSGMRQLNAGLGLLDRTPPQAVLHEQVPELLLAIPPERRESAIELMHWTYGAAAGAGFALLPEGLRRRRLTGPAYGLAIWAVFDLGIAPMFDLSYARESRPAERVVLIADHLLYGLVVGNARR